MAAAKRTAIAAAGLIAAMGGWRVVATLRDPIGPAPPGGFEAARTQSSYRTSSECRPCHADHDASWRRTFHRTMTQEPGAESIRAPFDGRTIEILGVRARPWRTEEGFYLDLPAPGSVEPVAHRIDRVTGSRRMQQFETRVDDRYVRLPLAWSIESQRWFHLSEAFFHADGEDFNTHRAVWDLNCIFCHTTAPAPGLDGEDRLNSRAAELGIACEGCHGPGEEHGRRMRSPLRRYAMRRTHPVDPTIVNPSRIEPSRSVQVCGHCHGQRLPVDRNQIRTILSRGDGYVPGQDLSLLFEPLSKTTMLGSHSFAPRFWPDGSPRLTAYEYQGVLDSPCYLRGSMTCLSCHTMHAGEPEGQLRPDLPGDAMCTQCHDGFTGTGLTAHTHHRADGSGSRCVSCHMPPVVYGVMTWHPTHKIDSPSPAAGAAHGTPDACTVCHTGRSRGWAARWTRSFWQEAAEAEDDAVPEMVRALFAGDAVYRTLAAFRLGQTSPDAAVGERVVPMLAELMNDPYPNVRRTARESLVRLTGRNDLPLALDPSAARDAARRDLQGAAPRPAPMTGWPFTADGRLDATLIEKWRSERREVDVAIGE